MVRDLASVERIVGDFARAVSAQGVRPERSCSSGLMLAASPVLKAIST